MDTAKRLASIPPSLTLSITSKAKKMREKGEDVVGFGAGEPDFDTPSHIKDVAKKAMDSGFTKYTPAGGIEELKRAVCKKFETENNLKYSEEEVIISCGAKHAIFNAILAICDEEDEVILPSPYWVSYPEMIKVVGAKPVILKTTKGQNFKITQDQLKKSITAKTKLLILNSPSNPTGMVYTRDELMEIKDTVVRRGMFCLSDEVYEKIIYDEREHISIASLGEDIKKLTIVVNGVSKSYAMTGWRIGYAAGPKEVIKAMTTLQSHSTSNPTSISQKAALAALQGPQEIVHKMVEEFGRRRDYITKRLNAMGLSCLKPEGAFYVFSEISAFLGKQYKGRKIKNSVDFSEILLEEAKVAVVPGAAFGMDDHIRFSYATSMENIEKGLWRLEDFLKGVN